MFYCVYFDFWQGDRAVWSGDGGERFILAMPSQQWGRRLVVMGVLQGAEAAFGVVIGFLPDREKTGKGITAQEQTIGPVVVGLFFSAYNRYIQDAVSKMAMRAAERGREEKSREEKDWTVLNLLD
ncbi:hypothetical protein TWF718_000781 [Orbilia javanica]|uniref:Uncharacterized protein n=1 Tax=Orbilia javanica TaxID=47235 RepID=A0AAN8MUF8_9PEZI